MEKQKEPNLLGIVPTNGSEEYFGLSS